MVSNTLRQKLMTIIKAPMRSKISTSDVAVSMWSTTALAEKLNDLESLVESECQRREQVLDESYNTLQFTLVRESVQNAEQRLLDELEALVKNDFHDLNDDSKGVYTEKQLRDFIASKRKGADTK